MRTSADENAEPIAPRMAPDRPPVHPLQRPAVRTSLDRSGSPEECGSHGYLFQCYGRFLPEKSKQFIDGGYLKIVQHKPSPLPDVREKVCEFDLGQRIGMGSIEEHQIQLVFKAVSRQSVLRLTLDEDHSFLPQAGPAAQLSDGPIRPFDCKRRVAIAGLR
ncbi:MAG TPA: hypothetical protein VKJ01_17220 [Candidatus Solibacter sp.]|nr:hypothetical protein [Candidatus Solibacter sp.]